MLSNEYAVQFLFIEVISEFIHSTTSMDFMKGHVAIQPHLPSFARARCML